MPSCYTRSTVSEYISDTQLDKIPPFVQPSTSSLQQRPLFSRSPIPVDQYLQAVLENLNLTLTGVRSLGHGEGAGKYRLEEYTPNFDAP